MNVIELSTVLDGIQELSWVSNHARQQLIGISRLELYDAREIIFQGKQCDRIYLVISGSLQTLKKTQTGEQLLNILYEKSIFGQNFLYGQSIDYEMIFAASAQSLVMALPIKETRAIFSECPETSPTFHTLERYYNAYSFIKNSTTLGDHLSPEFLIEFVSSFKQVHYTKDSFIFKQGDAPDGYYICFKGALHVIVEVDGTIVFTAPIREGDYFGELALTTDSCRKGSIQALTDVDCYYLSKETFSDLVQKEPDLLKGFQLLARLAYG